MPGRWVLILVPLDSWKISLQKVSTCSIRICSRNGVKSVYIQPAPYQKPKWKCRITCAVSSLLTQTWTSGPARIQMWGWAFKTVVTFKRSIFSTGHIISKDAEFNSLSFDILYPVRIINHSGDNWFSLCPSLIWTMHYSKIYSLTCLTLKKSRKNNKQLVIFKKRVFIIF